MAFFKFRKGGDEQPTPPTASESVEAMRKRARHRLVGAAVLVLIGVVGFPLLFDSQPRPIAVDIPIDIPDKRQSGAPLVLLPVPAATQVQRCGDRGARGAGQRLPASATGAQSGFCRDQGTAVAKPEPKPEPAVKPEPKPKPKAEETQSPRSSLKPKPSQWPNPPKKQRPSPMPKLLPTLPKLKPCWKAKRPSDAQSPRTKTGRQEARS